MVILAVMGILRMMIQIVIIRVRSVEAGLQMLIWQEKSQGDYDHGDLGDLDGLGDLNDLGGELLR